MGLINDIITGVHDHNLDNVMDAVTERRKILSRVSFIELKIGDRVRFNDKVRPQYMRGITARVVDKKTSKVVVELENTEHIGRFSKRITTPVTIVDRIANDPV